MKGLGLPVRIAVDYVHDISAGLFPGSVLGVWVVERGLKMAGVGALSVGRAADGLWLVLIFALALLVVTGSIRLRYWKLSVRASAVESKARAAAIKHSVFVLTQLAAAFVVALVL